MRRMARDPDEKAAAIAARQHGLITWCQALVNAGLTERQIRWRISTKRWRVAQRGVYAVEGSTASWQQTLLAAVLAARTETVVVTDERARLEEREDAVAAGRSALWLRACSAWTSQTLTSLVSRRRAPIVRGATSRRTDELPPTDVAYEDSVPTLAVPRLLVDLCGRVPDLAFVAILDDLLGRAIPTSVPRSTREPLRYGAAGKRSTAWSSSPGPAPRLRFVRGWSGTPAG